MSKFKILFISLVLMTVTYQTKSQDAKTLRGYSYGAFIGAAYSSQSADFSELPGIPNCCPRFESGSGSVFSFGGIFDYSLSEKIAVGVNLLFSTGHNKVSAAETKNTIVSGISVPASIDQLIETNALFLRKTMR